jgi:hypothetical protein
VVHGLASGAGTANPKKIIEIAQTGVRDSRELASIAIKELGSASS